MRNGHGREGETLTIEDETTWVDGRRARADRDRSGEGGPPRGTATHAERSSKSSLTSGSYPYWFMLPAGVIFTVLFRVPTFIAFYYSLTRLTLFDSEFIGLDLSDIAIDGSQHKAPFGGEGTGANPVDRGKCGWKWSLAADRHVDAR